MGRPINKKYFGNRNIGTTGTGDNAIGGEGVASINWSTLGSFRGNDGAHNPLIGLALPAPTLPDGVQATWDLLFEVDSVTTGAGHAGLVVGDTYTYAGLGSPVFTVATVPGSGNATFTVTNRGSFDIGSMPGDTTGVNITKVTGSGASTFMVDINFRLKSAVITEKGSGYIGSETFTVTLYPGSTGTAPAGTLVRTTDSGDVSSSTNQENAIIAYAKTTSGGTRKVADIVSQKGSNKFRVKTSDGVATCTLRTDGGNGVNTMDITVYDSAGGEYWVMKLSSHTCVLVQKGTNGGTQFANGTKVSWTFGSAVLNTSVKIQNA